MALSCLAARLRVAATLVFVVCVISQAPIKALGLDTIHFEAPPSAADNIALVTTLISTVATVLALENPDFNSLAVIEHGSKAIVEGIAFGQHGNFNNVLWCSYDTLAALRRLWAAFHTPLFREAVIVATTQQEVSTPEATKSSHEQENESRLKLVFGILLALVEGGIRLHNVVHNTNNTNSYAQLTGNNQAIFHNPEAERYWLDTVAQMARLANYSLYAEGNIEMLFYLSIFIVCSIQAYRIEGGTAKQVEIVKNAVTARV